MDPIIQVKQLHKWLKEREVTVIDVRSELSEPDNGEKVYHEGHIPGAFYLHLERDLSGEKAEHGGNHPLPEAAAFAEKVRQIGVSSEKPVIIYDAANEMFASRAWWLFVYFGHPEVYVLDGGLNAWEEAGYGLSTETPTTIEGSFTVNTQNNMIRSMVEVKNRQEKVALLDSRAPARYRGETEPLYAVAGHIPGAKNYFWQDVLDADGNWKDQQTLQGHFSNLKQADEIIVSCGSGVSACPNIVALKRAGFENVTLYPGSYSDWISYADNDVTKGDA